MDCFSGQLPAKALLVDWPERQSMALWLAQWQKNGKMALSLLEVIKPQIIKNVEHRSHKSTDCCSGQLPANALLVDWPEMQSRALQLAQW